MAGDGGGGSGDKEPLKTGKMIVWGHSRHCFGGGGARRKPANEAGWRRVGWRRRHCVLTSDGNAQND